MRPAMAKKGNTGNEILESEKSSQIFFFECSTWVAHKSLYVFGQKRVQFNGNKGYSSTRIEKKGYTSKVQGQKKGTQQFRMSCRIKKSANAELKNTRLQNLTCDDFFLMWSFCFSLRTPSLLETHRITSSATSTSRPLSGGLSIENNRSTY